MSGDEIAYWDAEALDDPRYAAGIWGMTADDDAEQTVDRIIRILDAGMPPEDGEIIEIGCGPGRLLKRMADLYGDAHFIGFDASPEMGRLYWSTPVPANTTFFRCDPLGILGPPDEIDLVYAVELFQHLDDKGVRHYIADAYRMLKPGGKFIAQFVIRGEPGPHSFPRDHQQIAFMFDERWENLGFNEGAVHEDWTWVAATKA